MSIDRCRLQQREHVDSRILSQPEKRPVHGRNSQANRDVRRIVEVACGKVATSSFIFSAEALLEGGPIETHKLKRDNFSSRALFEALR
jgi:hypothetical protein